MKIFSTFTLCILFTFVTSSFVFAEQTCEEKLQNAEARAATAERKALRLEKKMKAMQEVHRIEKKIDNGEKLTEEESAIFWNNPFL